MLQDGLMASPSLDKGNNARSLEDNDMHIGEAFHLPLRSSHHNRAETYTTFPKAK